MKLNKKIELKDKIKKNDGIDLNNKRKSKKTKLKYIKLKNKDKLNNEKNFFELFFEKVWIKNIFEQNKNRDLIKKSLLEENLKKNDLTLKEIKKLKENSVKTAVFVSLFVLLFSELILHKFEISLAISLLSFALLFFLLINYPIIKKRKYAKLLESELAFFLTNLITELRVGKDIFSAIAFVNEGKIGKEYQKVLRDVKNGISFQKALLEMNMRINSFAIKRANSNLYNIYLHGGDSFGLSKFSSELMIRQRIESKEFSGKMVVFALVFIAVSAIVPAMFASFILIGSYFMQIQFSPIEIFIIIVFVFPLIDLMVLQMINSKTPMFLRNK